MENKNPIQVADRLFGALELLAEHGDMGLVEVSEMLGLNKSTAHRVLNSLIYMGYARQNKENGRYEPTLKTVATANKIMGRIDVIQTVRPYLRRLMEMSEETVHFVRLEGDEAVYIDKVEAPGNGVQMVSRIGSRLPLYCSGVGKAMLAQMGDQEVSEIWEHSNVRALTEHTITDYERFQEEIREIRRRGYALDNEENEVGVRCIATAFETPAADGRYAFSISAPAGRMNDARIRELAAYILKIKAKLMKEWQL